MTWPLWLLPVSFLLSIFSEANEQLEEKVSYPEGEHSPSPSERGSLLLTAPAKQVAEGKLRTCFIIFLLHFLLMFQLFCGSHGP